MGTVVSFQVCLLSSFLTSAVVQATNSVYIESSYIQGVIAETIFAVNYAYLRNVTFQVNTAGTGKERRIYTHPTVSTIRTTGSVTLEGIVFNNSLVNIGVESVNITATDVRLINNSSEYSQFC